MFSKIVVFFNIGCNVQINVQFFITITILLLLFLLYYYYHYSFIISLVKWLRKRKTFLKCLLNLETMLL